MVRCDSCDGVPCKHCGAGNEPAARFCSQCGEELNTAGHEAAASATEERRQVTILFADLVGSSALLEAVGAERFHEMLREYHRECAQVIARLGGYLAQPLGDGFLAYFGYPNTFEDAARRALTAALALVDAVARLARRHDRPLQARVGADTGIVSIGLVGRDPTGDKLAVGEAVNRAARIQSLAAPSHVVVSGTTRRLTEGFFEFRSLGAVELKGLSGVVDLHELVRGTGARDRIRAAAITGLTPFIAKGSQMGALFELWQEARVGRSRVVLLTAEAGLGKSRHVLMLEDEARTGQALVLEAHCSPEQQTSPLHPMAQVIRDHLGFGALATDEQRLSALEKSLPLNASTEDVALLATALALPPSAGYAAPAFLPQRQHAATLQALVGWLRARAEELPTLLVLEDLHWADASTLELLTALAADSATRMMILATTRPLEAREPAWVSLVAAKGLIGLTLERTAREVSRQIVAGVTGGRMLPAEVMDLILDRAADTPLFLEEITRAVIVSSDLRLEHDRYELVGPVTELSVPATLRDALAAQLDLIGGSKPLLGLAAAIGREFTVDLVCTASGRTEAEVVPELELIAQVGIIRQAPAFPLTSYLFKHALMQQEVYDDLPSATKRAYHRQIAEALARSPGLVQAEPQLLGHHHAQAGDAAQAVAAYARAGQAALARSAYFEASNAFAVAIRQSHLLPESPARDRMEVDLVAARGFTLLSTRGFSDKQVEAAYGRAMQLCERVGHETPFRVLYGVWAYQLTHGGVATAIDLMPWFEAVLARMPDANEELAARTVLGVTAFSRGDLRGVHGHLERAAALIDRDNPMVQHFTLLERYGFDSVLNALMFLGWTELIEGRPEACRARIEEALALADKTAQAYIIATVLSVAGSIAHHLSDDVAARGYGQRLMTLAEENHFLYWTGGALCMLGWADCRAGAVAQGLPLLQQSAALFRAMGDTYVLPYFLSYLVEVHIAARQLDEAGRHLEDVLRLSELRGTLVFVAEYTRLQGEVARGKGDHDIAERLFRLAFARARVQGAGLFELRAATSLARLLEERGRRAEAAAALREPTASLAGLLALPEGQAAADLLRSLGP